MNDFMTWLYEHYIEPEIRLQPKDDGDTFRFSLMESAADPQDRGDITAALRVYACHCFQLGLRTGAGLGQLL